MILAFAIAMIGSSSPAMINCEGAARSGGGADRAQCALAQEPYSLRTTEPTVLRPSRSRWACAASCRG